MASSHETHDRLAREFVQTVVAQTKTDSEMMVVTESMILATLLTLMKVHGLRPSSCVHMAETAFHQAIERFSAVGPRS